MLFAHHYRRLVAKRYRNQLLLAEILFVCALLPIKISAQYRFDSWTTDNGLPQASVNSIVQSDDGFLWFSTFGGLVRYDGLRFQVFNAGNSKGIKSGRFTNIIKGDNGSLWVATEAQGVSRYQNNVFATYSTETGLPDNLISRMDMTIGGDFLISSGNSLFYWNGDNFASYLPVQGEPTANILQRMPDGAVWFLDGSRLRKFEKGQITVDFAPDFTIHRVFEDSQGRAWIAGNQDELFMLKDGKLSTYSEKNGFPKCRFINAIEDRNGRILFSTPLGLLIFENGKFSRFTTKNGLVSDKVTTTYQDREGSIWVGTQGGLSRITEATVTPYSTANGLANDNVYPIYQDRRGKIWIGSWSGLTVYENGQFQNVSQKFSLVGENISAIYEDRQDTIWICTWSGKIVQINQDKIITLPPNEQLGSHIRAVHQNRAGKMWFGTTRGLVSVENNIFTTFNAKDGIPGKAVYVIHEDRNGQLWIGSDGGLTKFKDGVFTAFTEKEGFADNIVRAIYEDNDGTLWIGMYDSGLYRYKQGKFTHFTTEQGLFDNGVFQIIEDKAGNFWISCNQGVYRVKKTELNELAENRLAKITSILYNKRDGMLNSECNGGTQPAGIMAQDGRIWFPTQKGVAVINPNKIPLNSQPPPVAVQSLSVDTKPVDIRLPIKINPGQTNLEIHYSGLSFINPELVKFKYKLAGLDDEWVDAGSRRTAYYTHLLPGNYRFVVIAANRDGIWNEQGATLEIEVLPPFWRTRFFLALVLFAILLTGFALYRWRIGKLKHSKAVQEAFSRQLIESQEEERTRIAVELHDSLGQILVLIKNWATLGLQAKNEQKYEKTNLNEISAAASDAINEVREIAYNLGPYQLDRLGLRTSIEEMVQKVTTSSSIQFEVKIDKIDDYFDKQTKINIFRILQEAVNNIVKHSAATKATLKIEIPGSQITLQISDNGRGFVAENVNFHGKRGFGLFGMTERVKLLQGEIFIKAEPESGTTIFIRLPIEENRNGK
jgi:signal transduction histidine kinase/ligand-binding sensor domain-containing protein